MTEKPKDDPENREAAADEQAPSKGSDRAAESQEGPTGRKRRYVFAIILLIVIVGLGLGLGLGLEQDDDDDDGSSDDGPLGAAEKCALDSRDMLETNQEINQSFYDTLVWRGIDNCSDEGKGEICKIDGGNLQEKMNDFKDVCELNGGVPLETEGGDVFGDSLLMCTDDQNKLFGLVPDDYIFCGASSCSELLLSEVIHATLFQVSYDTEELLGLTCTVEFDDTLDFFELCKERFLPTGQVCEATENVCAFYTELRPLSCKGFCEQGGGTCVAGYTYNEFSCERDGDWDACDDVPGDDWCTCSF